MKPIAVLTSTISEFISNQWQRHKKRCFVCILSLVCLLFHSRLFRTFGNLLVVSETVENSDDLLLLSGDRRFDLAKELYALNSERQIIRLPLAPNRLEQRGITRSTREIFHKELSLRQIPRENQNVLSSSKKNETSQFDPIKDWFAQNSDSSLAVICDEMDSARVHYTLTKAFPELSGSIKIHALKDRRFGVHDWWKSRSGIRKFVLSSLSLMNAYVRDEFTSFSGHDINFEAYVEELASEQFYLRSDEKDSKLRAAVANFLDVGSSPEEVDFVLTLPGDENVRPFVGAALIRAGFAEKALIIKNPPSPDVEDGIELNTAEVIQRVMLHQGVDANQIVELTGFSNSTFDDAVLTKRFLDDHPKSRIAVVTSHYHTRRARMVFRYVFGERSDDFIFLSAPTDEFTKQNWWQTEIGTNMVLTEYLKLGIYWIQYSHGKYWLVFFVVASAGLYWRRRKPKDHDITGVIQDEVPW